MKLLILTAPKYHQMPLTQTNAAAKNGSLVKCILPFERNLQFMCRNFRFQRTQLIVIAASSKKNKHQSSELRKKDPIKPMIQLGYLYV